MSTATHASRPAWGTWYNAYGADNPGFDPDPSHAFVIRGVATGAPSCEQITGQGEDEVRHYVFGLRVPRRGHPDPEQITLYFFDPVMPGHDGWPLWLKLLDAGALVEVEVGLVDIPDLVDEGGALRDPGRDILATSIKVFVPERNG